MASKILAQQAVADKAAKKHIKTAIQTGGTVPYSLSRLLELKCSLKTIRAVIREKK